MGVYGKKDDIVRPDQWKVLLNSAPHARIERFPNAGHFLMLDTPDQFFYVLKDFLNEELKSCMSQTDKQLFIQRMGRILILALTEILGEDETRTILNRIGFLEQTSLQDGKESISTSPDDMARQVQTELEYAYGYPGWSWVSHTGGTCLLKIQPARIWGRIGFYRDKFPAAAPAKKDQSRV